MGADNWRICPKCRETKNVAREQAILEAGQAYGKVPSAEYIAMAEAANKPVELKETLREDYEIGTDKEGTFSVSYSCSCSACSFRFQFAAERDVFKQSGGNNA